MQDIMQGRGKRDEQGKPQMLSRMCHLKDGVGGESGQLRDDE